MERRCAGGRRAGRGRRVGLGGEGALLLAALLVGCAGEGGPQESPSTPAPDFGDAVVVENGPPPDPSWSVDSIPLWALGEAEGDSVAIFTRITGVLPVGDGGFAVLDATPATLRLYSAEGVLTGILGGRGSDPGSLDLPATLLPGGGDTLVVHDVALRRRLRFHPLDGFLDGEPMEFGGEALLGRLPSGERLVRRDEELPRPLPTGLLERQVTFHLQETFPEGLGGEVQLGRFGAVPLMVHGPGEGGTPEVTPVPFRAAPLAAPWNDGVVVADGTPDLREYDRSGALVRVIRTGIPPRPVERGWVEDFMRSRTGGIPDPALRSRIQEDLAGMPFPDHMPAFADLRTDPLGNLWLLATRLPGEPAVQRWWVVAPSGTTLGMVRMPPRVSLRVPGEDVVLGSVADDAGVIRIVRHQLRK